MKITKIDDLIIAALELQFGIVSDSSKEIISALDESDNEVRKIKQIKGKPMNTLFRGENYDS